MNGKYIEQVPELAKTNKGNIYMSRTSPPSVIRAYREQFQRDFTLFLKCRGEEVVSGGRMVLTILGRRSNDPCSKECCFVWDLLATALNEMVMEVYHISIPLLSIVDLLQLFNSKH